MHALKVVFGALGLVLSVATNLEAIKPLLQAVGYVFDCLPSKSQFDTDTAFSVN